MSIGTTTIAARTGELGTRTCTRTRPAGCLCAWPNGSHWASWSDAWRMPLTGTFIAAGAGR